jgi:deazaflavin-dependent oxidoreductase (nitroreductase family)
VAKQYVVGGKVRFVNGLMRVFTAVGVSGPTVMMTMKGRQSGVARTVPVSPIDVGGHRYLVSPYGEVGWVSNVRANPHVEFRRRRHVETVTVTEIPAAEAAPVLEAYFAREKMTRPYFDVPAAPSADDFAAVAAAHPVFVVAATG